MKSKIEIDPATQMDAGYVVKLNSINDAFEFPLGFMNAPQTTFTAWIVEVSKLISRLHLINFHHIIILMTIGGFDLFYIF